MGSPTTAPPDCDYVVVGSGAGGGTLAARLAEAGRTVVLLEAGGDPLEVGGGGSEAMGESRLPDDYEVPAFHAFACENDAMAWNFFVRHYADDSAQRRDGKYRETWDGTRVDGVLYPRAGVLGGCTAHNAMILVAPHDADWDGIAALTGDASWNARNMRRYFQRLENCRHRWLHRWLAKVGFDPTGHGWKGWLDTEKTDPKSALGDRSLLKVMLACAHEAFHRVGHPLSQLRWLSQGLFDPNDGRLVAQNAVGLGYIPLSTRNHARAGARERVLETARRYPDRLRVELNALATRVLLDHDNRAVGVEYLHGERLYRAHCRANCAPGERRQVRAAAEVVLAGGAFNTPQLLMLSGIGPGAQLRGHGIEVKVDLDGVGKNLQDRYEVSVVNRMRFDSWRVLQGARFARTDRQYREWARARSGVYASNGAILGVVERSAPARPVPDLFLLGLLGNFQGYFPTFSRLLAEHPNYLTWTILKAHTNNRAGEVTLRSADPQDTPSINFHYFDEGSDASGEDLDSVVAGIEFVRRMTAGLKAANLIAEEELPGEHVASNGELKAFVRDNAWGHHASCTCPIGARDQGGVVAGDFRVHGARGLRVVDASVFPRIPGFFLASAVYMIAEKAADVILADARRAAI